MLLATPGQTYVCHAVSINSSSSGSGSGSSSSSGNTISSVNSSHSKILGRASYRSLDSSSRNKIALSSTATTQGALLMKTISVRANRDSNFPGSIQSTQASSKSNNVNVTIYNVNHNIASNTNGTTTNGIVSNNHANPTTTSALLSSNVATTKAASDPTSSTSKSAATLASFTSLSSTTSNVILSTAFVKTLTVPPTELHRSSAARARCYSADSLYDEMCHFKPIRSVPTTPWKCGSKSRGATVKAPKACVAQKDAYCDLKLDVTVTKTKLQRGCTKAKSKAKPKLSANLIPHMKPSPSAFVRLFLHSNSYTVPSSNPLQSVKQTGVGELQNDSKKSTKTTKKTPKSKSTKKKTQPKVEPTDEMAASKSKTSNSKKRKTEKTHRPKETKKASKAKKPKISEVSRESPPLTRGRIRMQENRQLYGPLG